jgi:hypothetical protein
MRKDEHLSIISKEDFIKAIIKSHLEMMNFRNHDNKVILKIITVILVVFVIAMTILLFLVSKIIGITATQIISGMLFFLFLGIAVVRMDLKKILLYSEKDLEALANYEKEIELMKTFSALGALVTSQTFLLQTRNLGLSQTFLEFESLINLLNKYLPPDLYQEDIQLLKKSGMSIYEDVTFFGKKEGYRISYF